MTSLKKFILVLALVCGVFSTLNVKDGIYNVTEDNFEEFMEFAKDRQATFYLKLYTPMCPHCQTLKPIYIEAAKQLQNDPDGLYILGEVNTMFNDRIGKHFQIKGVPTIFSFSPLNDYMPVMFTKNRTVFDLVTEIELASGLISKELATHAEFEQRFSIREENILLGIFEDDKNNLFHEMEQIKNEFNFLRIYYTFNVKEFQEKFKLPKGENYILMFHNRKFVKPGDEVFAIYSANKHTSLRNFIINEYTYDVEILNDKVEKIYNMQRLPRAILFTPFANRTNEVLELALQLKSLGKKYKGRLNVYIQDADPKTARKYKLAGNATYIIFDTDKDQSKYRYVDKIFDKDIDSDALMEFTARFFEGKAPKFIRSAEVNKDDLEEPVYPVVAKTYDQIVKDPKKHVFLRFFDKMLQRFSDQFLMRKEWWKVGKHFANNANDLLIAEIEINDNDVPEYFLHQMNVEGHYYFMFTKNQKEEPFVYTGKVNTEELIKFAEKHIGKDENPKKVDL